MQCPIDKVDLVMTEREGIEIDYCPQCRGVWLDRGELDKMIDRAPAPDASYKGENYEPSHYHDVHKRPHEQYDNHGLHHKKRKKESFLGDLFDF